MSREPFDKVRRFLELLHDTKLTDEWDAPVLVIGDEGVGKSTFALGCVWNWQQIRGDEPTVESVLSRLVWDETQEFKEALAEYPRRSAIPVMDAARIMMKKKSMDPEQIEAQQDMLDTRTNENLILLCYQDYGDVPDFLARRRARYAFKVPARGVVRGFNRDSLDEVYDSGGEEWPEADLLDQFPSLEGTELWAEFKRRDREHKRERMHANDSEDDDEDDSMSLEEVVEDIKATGIEPFVSVNPANKQKTVDKDLIQFEYDLSHREARTVKKVVARDVDLDEVSGEPAPS